ncbi:MAG TPA: DUF4136 domain-containing protein [Thermoanaerobaculia bacterium]|jgi:hypothetical protein
MRRIPIGSIVAAIACATLLACSATSTLKTDVGFDRKADFPRYKTWGWKDDGSIRDPVWKRRVQAVLEDELAKHGLTRSEQNPDLWLAVHWRLSSEQQVVSYSPAWGYGWGPYWAAPAMTTVYDVPAGTMIVDLVDAGKKEIVWRATASQEIQANKENAEREDRLREIVAHLFAGYPPAGT